MSLTVDELLLRLELLSLAGHANSRVVFDTMAACFDSHCVEVSGCSDYEDPPLVVLSTEGYPGRCRLPKLPDAFLAWARSEIKACEASGWKDDAYVGAGLRLGELREYVQRTGVD